MVALGWCDAIGFFSDDTTVQVRSDRMKTAPYGIKGGQPARKSRIHVVSNGKKQSKPSKFMVTVNADDAMEIQWPGAGGWGDPLNSDPNQILHDVIEEKISLHRARNTYGVVISEETRGYRFHRHGRATASLATQKLTFADVCAPVSPTLHINLLLRTNYHRSWRS